MKAKLYSVPNTLLSSYKKIRTTKLSCKEKAISNPLLYACKQKLVNVSSVVNERGTK